MRKRTAKIIDTAVVMAILVGGLVGLGWTGSMSASNQAGILGIYQLRIFSAVMVLVSAWHVRGLSKERITKIAQTVHHWQANRGQIPHLPTPNEAPKRRKHKKRFSEPTEGGFEERRETTGQILKSLGIERGGPKTEDLTPAKKEIVEKPTIPGGDSDKRQVILRRKWGILIQRLEAGERIFISRNTHMGSIRGIHILHAARSDLKRLGYRCKIKKGDHDGYIWLESGNE